MSRIQVHDRLIDCFCTYQDTVEDTDASLVRTYRQQVVKVPDGFDAATIALVLKGTVRFAKTANAVFIRHLGAANADPVPFSELRAGITVTDDGRAVIEACVAAARTDALADALALLFIEAHPKLCSTERPDAPDDEDGIDDAEDYEDGDAAASASDASDEEEDE